MGAAVGLVRTHGHVVCLGYRHPSRNWDHRDGKRNKDSQDGSSKTHRFGLIQGTDCGQVTGR
jgi:hypothetical protein